MTEYKCGSAKSCKYGDMCKPNFNIGACSHYKAEEPQTNEEWIHTLNTEQLAEVLFSWYKLGRRDVINNHTEVKKDWLIERLKQPHTNKE